MGHCRKTSWVADQHLLGFRKELLGLWTHASILHGNVCCLLKGPQLYDEFMGGLEFTYHTLSYIVLHCHTLHFLDQAEYQWAVTCLNLIFWVLLSAQSSTQGFEFAP